MEPPISAPSPTSDEQRRRGQIRVFVIILAAVCVGFTILPVRTAIRKPNYDKDYSLWYDTGRQVLRGDALYPTTSGEQFPYMYPPFAAVIVFAPLSVLPLPLFVAVLAAASAAAWFASLWLAVYVATGSWRHPNLLLYAGPAAVSAPFVWDVFFLGQPNIVLLALVLGAMASLRVGRQWRAGWLLSVAVAFKAFPILISVYFVWRRRWGALAATALGTVLLLVVLPAPIRGFERNAAELRTWALGMVAINMSGDQIAQRRNAGFGYGNQSLMSIVHRLTRPVPADIRDGKTLTVNLIDLPAGVAQGVFIALALGLCGVYLLVMPRERRRTPATDAGEQAMLLFLTIFLSPLGWTYYYCWLIPAVVVVVDVLCTGAALDRRVVGCGLGIAMAAFGLAALQDVTVLPQGYGATAAGGLAMFATLAWILRREAAKRPDNGGRLSGGLLEVPPRR